MAKSRSTLFGIKACGIAGLCVLSGIIGASLTRDFGTIQNTMSYSDFVSIMLTAVSVLMTVLAIILAVAGVMGWTTIEQKVHAKTEDFLAKGFQDGGRLNRMVVDLAKKKTEETMFEGVRPVDEDDASEVGAQKADEK